jgi:hypothetical protein
MNAMKKSVRFLLALISGLGATATVFSAPVFQRPAEESDLSRMRGDVERVGTTMRTIIQREHARQSARF